MAAVGQKLCIVASGINDSKKTFSIPNPKTGVTFTEADDFISAYGQIYGLAPTTESVYYENVTHTPVTPA